jgi:hypothetical protein
VPQARSLDPRSQLASPRLRAQADEVRLLIDVSKPDIEQGKVAASAGLFKVGSVKVNLRGSVAWISCSAPNGGTLVGDPRPTCIKPGAEDQVWKYEIGDQDSELLDSGVGIDPHSLRRRGGTISWTHGGEAKTASLR